MMPHLINSQSTPDFRSFDHGSSPDSSRAVLESALAAARPRLLRLARRHGVAVDAADDVVQDTYVEAWRHIDRLHAPEGIEAWLASICRHMCRRWTRARS